MEDIAVKKKDIDEKLNAEMGRLDNLKSALKHSNQMTENMMDILSSFDSRLKRLEDTIMPVYQESGQLQKRHENIEITLNILDKVLETYHVADEVDNTIREGPSGSLEEYLECMEKLRKAHEYFSANNADTPEMSHVATLFDAGKDALEREFRNLLTRNSKPVPAITIIDAISVDEEFPDNEPVTIDHMPVKVLEELQQIANWLQNCGMDTDYVQVFSKLRSDTLVKSIQGLKDNLRSGSHDSCNTNYSASPAPSGKVKLRETPSKKGPKGIQALVKKASLQLIYQQMVVDAAGKKMGSPSSSDGKDEISEKEIEVYCTSVSALLKLIQSEHELMNGIIADRLKARVFERVIEAALANVIKEGEHIVQSTRRAVSRNDFAAVLYIFPVGKHLRAIRPEFEEILEGCAAAIKQRLSGLITAFDVTGAKALQEYIDGIRNDPDKASNMPRDGTVHQLTSNTQLFLEQLMEFTETAGNQIIYQSVKCFHLK